MNKFLEIKEKDKNKKVFVSRGGIKLDFALEYFNINIEGRVCADLGCSTGGFTDCLLQRGAKKVYAVDTGKGVLDWKLRQDERVVVMENTNALHLVLPELVDFVSVDASWTKQSKIIPQIAGLLKNNGEIVSLLKPHYETSKVFLKNGRVDDFFTEEIVENVKQELSGLGFVVSGLVCSPILGKKGKNTEYFIRIKK